MKRKSYGFTIVELLIVIVIIGILAALVIVAYNSLQQRARNTSRIANAKEIQKLVNAYVAQEGKYPYAAHACVGSGYTDWDSDGSLDCWVKGVYVIHPVSAMDTELKKVANIPTVESSAVAGTSRGFGYVQRMVDGKAGRATIGWWLEGNNQNCGVSGILTAVGSDYQTNGAINTDTSYGGTHCAIAIDEP